VSILQSGSVRLLETEYNSALFNMALDEALMHELEAKSDGSGNQATVHPFPSAILRIYGWKPAAVSIGYFQSMELEVQVNECKKRGIDLVRRITGGGAVLHEAELTYSFVTNTFASDIMQSYILICNPVVQAIRKLGFDARFAPLNDIIIGNGVKVSGNAQTRRKNVLLQHGTILLDLDVERMFSVLKVPSEKMKDKVIDDVKKRVVGINRSFDEVAMRYHISGRIMFLSQSAQPLTEAKNFSSLKSCLAGLDLIP